MATVTTTTAANPLVFPSQTQIERVGGGFIYVMVTAATANTFELWRSVNNGSSWALLVSTVRANLAQIGSIQVLRNPYNQLVWTYRTFEGGQDRVYIRTISDLGAATVTWNAELIVAATAAGSAGAVLSGIDLANVTISGQYHYTVVAVGTQNGAAFGTQLYVAYGSTLASLAVNSSLIAGTRAWYTTGTGWITPSIDIEHTGDGHSGSAPHLWVAWGRTQTYLVKLSWTGNGWSGPGSPVKLNPTTLTPPQDSIAARWDGQRFVTAVPDPVATSTVTVLERNRSNSTTVIRATPTHPTGVVRNCSIGYNSVTGDLRVFAVGTSTTVLYYTDFIRATGVWSSWTTVTATAVLGTTGNNYSVRRATNGRYDVLTAHAGTPNTIVHTALSLSYAPNVPTWDTDTMQLQSGSAADVNGPLVLDWIFADPDAADTQSAYAVSRQIGAGALAYWRASDSTWQAAEVQNASATSAITLPQPWGAGTDAATTFKAKVWDSASIASTYSDGYVVVPSTVVNPVITAPTVAQVLTADTVPVAWTAAEQVARRVRLHVLVAADAFGRTVAAGSLGSADYGGAYTNAGGAGTDYAVSGGVGRHTQSTVAIRESKLAGVSAADFDAVVGPFTVPVTPTGGPVELCLRGRYVDANNFVDFRIFATTSNTLTVSIRQWVGGVETATAFVTVPGLTSASSVWMHCQADGSTLQLRIWSATAAEPQSIWHVTLTGATQLSTGPVAIRTGPNAGNTNTLPFTITFDNLLLRVLAPVYDSGWQSTPDTGLTPPVRLPDLTQWTVGVATRNLEGLPSTEQFVSFNIDYVEPAPATLTATPTPTSGVITVAVTNAAAVGAQPAVADQDVYARPNIAGANMLSNPGFEVNTTGWLAINATLARSSTQAHSGGWSGFVTPDGINTPARIESSAAATVTAVEGQWWTVDGWIWCTTANKPMQIGIVWTTAGGSFISASTLQVTPIAGAWLYLLFAAQAPVTTGKAGARAGLSGLPAATDTFYVDDMRLRPTDNTVGSRVAAGILSGATVADWRAASGVDYEYRVLTRAVNGTSTYGPWTA